MSLRRLTLAFSLICATWVTAPVQAANGQAVFNNVCTACHTAGIAGAPKVGDKQAWGPRIAEGQSVLTAHAYVGLGAMPAKGGKPDLSLEDFASAVAFMANRAGATWRDPDAQQIQAIRTEIAKREKELAESKKGRK